MLRTGPKKEKIWLRTNPFHLNWEQASIHSQFSYARGRVQLPNIKTRTTCSQAGLQIEVSWNTEGSLHQGESNPEPLHGHPLTCREEPTHSRLTPRSGRVGLLAMITTGAVFFLFTSVADAKYGFASGLARSNWAKEAQNHTDADKGRHMLTKFGFELIN